jgi:hypothetical protein
MSGERRWLAAYECEQAIIGFFNCLDDRKFDQMASKFSVDGRWIRATGAVLEGRAAVLQAMNERPASVQSRHLVSNFEFEFVDDQTARSRCCVTVYRIDGKVGDSDPAPMVYAFNNEFKLRDGAWKIELHHGRRAFAAE